MEYVFESDEKNAPPKSVNATNSRYRFGWSHFPVYEFVVLGGQPLYFALLMLSIVYLHLLFTGKIKDEPEGGKDVWWCLADGGTLEYVFETGHDYPHALQALWKSPRSRGRI